MYDVAVLGGGPAGASSAIALSRRGFDVVLLESTNFDRPRFGETLPPEATPVLRELGVWDAFVATSPMPSPGMISVWGSAVPFEQSYVSNRFGSGWHVDRNGFDSMLCEAATSVGATVLLGTRALRCVEGQGAPWRIDTASVDAPTFYARFLIDATGRNGFRVPAGAKRIVDDALVAIFLTFSVDFSGSDIRTLLEATPDGWWYSAPLPSDLMVAAFFVDPQSYGVEHLDLPAALANAPRTFGRMGDARPSSSALVSVSSSLRQNVTTPMHASVGDAASSFDPLSGYGITKALRDGIDVARAIEARTLEQFSDNVKLRFGSYLWQKRAFYASESRWPERSFWRRRNGAP